MKLINRARDLNIFVQLLFVIRTELYFSLVGVPIVYSITQNRLVRPKSYQLNLLVFSNCLVEISTPTRPERIDVILAISIRVNDASHYGCLLSTLPYIG